jgi:hypothetical protein
MDKFADDKRGVDCFWALCREYETLLKFASYFLGHINGTGGDPDTAPKFKEFLQSSHWLSYSIIGLDKDKLWANYGKWAGLEEFDPLGEAVLDAVSRHNVFANIVEDKMFITIH